MMKHYQPKVALFMATALLFATAITTQSSAAQSGGPSSVITARPIVPALVAPPSGLVVVLETHDLNDTKSWHKALNNDSISGVALQIHWSDIEPYTDKPDWSKLDALFAAAKKSKKWVHLLIFPGFFTPLWAEKGVQTDKFPIQYGPGKGDRTRLPMPWDSVYLTNWLAFVKEVSDRYGTSPALRLVAASGPTSVSAEFTLPNSPTDLNKWKADGYTPKKYTDAWKQVLKAYAADFPAQYISVSQGEGLDINDQGKIDRTDHLHTSTRDTIIDEASTILGHRFALQSSNVHAGAGPHTSNSVEEDEFVIGYIGRIVTGFQLRTNALHNSEVMGAKGNPSLALSKSIDLATRQNGAGQIVNYVEIYEPDVLASEMQKVLADAALSCFFESPPHGLCNPPATVPPRR
jgi:hypothetical protein